MRLTIIKADGLVSVNGEGYMGIDLSALDDDFHALQWYDTVGEIEWKHLGVSGLRIVENEQISDITPFQWCISAWESAKAAAEAAAQEQQP